MQKRFCMQEANLCQPQKKMHGGKDSVPGAAETAACWRGLRWRRWQRLSSRWFPSGPRPHLRFVCFCFKFLSLLSVSTIPSFSTLGFRSLFLKFCGFSLSFGLSLSHCLGFFFLFFGSPSCSLLFFFSPLFFGFFSIYRGKVLGPMVVGSGCRGWLNHPRQPGAVFFSLSAGGRPTTSIGGPTVWGLGLFVEK